MKGFGWTQFHQSWSENGRPHSVEYLATKLKDMFKTAKLTIPTEPPINTPKRIKLPVLGNQIEMVKALDKDNIKDKDKFKERATSSGRKEKNKV